jgi:hypothetical protein
VEILSKSFEDRLQEIDAYLDVLDLFEHEAHRGPPKIGGTTITGQQQKIMYSSVYLQLYNLVEATATWCIDAVARAVADGSRWRPADLTDELRREWIRTTARTHVSLNHDHRLQQTVDVCNWLLRASPIAAWSVEKGGGGNWDDVLLEEVTARIGCELRISKIVYSQIKRVIRDDKSALALVKHLRNQLAHGDLSFSECGQGVTVTELREIKNRTAAYLREVVAAFQSYIDGFKFLLPASRPAGGAAG